MAAAPLDSIERFTDRVADYAKFRPGYPPAVLEFLRRDAGLTSVTVVADVGCGPGNSARPFLENGNVVHGVEPNVAMRQAAEALTVEFPNFHVVAGTAEDTTLASASIDLVVVGQAFHWFRPAETRREFQRILRPGGQVVILWNTFRSEASSFMREYEALLYEFGTDYAKVRHQNVPQQTLADFFAPGGYRQAKFDNEQLLDWEGLRGRLLSSSYAPSADHPRRPPMLLALRSLFDRHQVDGQVRMLYDAEVYLGRVS